MVAALADEKFKPAAARKEHEESMLKKHTNMCSKDPQLAISYIWCTCIAKVPGS